ncbi:MAG: amidohydrolase family protein [Longimicrobiales bacterium]
MRRGSRLAGTATVVALLVLCAPAARAQEGLVVLTRANVLDVRSGQVTAAASVVIDDGRIRSIERAAFTPPAAATVIDVDGRFVLPGLMDAHTHISSLAAARRALESGVTTVRSVSVGGYRDVALRELVRQGRLAGPDMLAAGVFVTPELGESALADPRLAPLFGETIDTPEELAALVEVNLAHGVDWVKTRGTERAGLPNTDPRKQTYTEAQLRAVVEAADGVPVAAHAHGDEGAAAAVRAGVRSIEHGTYLSDATLRLMKERGTYLVPTYTTVVDLTQPGGDYDNPILFVRGLHMLPRLADTVRRAHALEVPIVTGADTGYGAESVTRVAHEVAAFVELGMTPLEAIQAATTTAAALLGIDDRTGRVEAGLEADLIVVERNPLEDVIALQDVLVVISNGQVALNRLPFAR